MHSDGERHAESLLPVEQVKVTTRLMSLYYTLTTVLDELYDLRSLIPRLTQQMLREQLPAQQWHTVIRTLDGPVGMLTSLIRLCQNSPTSPLKNKLPRRTLQAPRGLEWF